jgi:hypothetical protein
MVDTAKLYKTLYRCRAQNFSQDVKNDGIVPIISLDVRIFQKRSPKCPISRDLHIRRFLA